jgi:hypothetical protein
VDLQLLKRSKQTARFSRWVLLHQQAALELDHAPTRLGQPAPDELDAPRA